MYTLGGGGDAERGWGRLDESWRAIEELRAYGAEPTWFGLGDRDLGTHLHRTGLLAAGVPLSEVTARLCARWWARPRPAAAADDRRPGRDARGRSPTPMRPAAAGRCTSRSTGCGCTPGPRRSAITQVGIEDAARRPGSRRRSRRADLVLVGPSNPVVSIGPILGVPGSATAVRATPAPVVGFSGILRGAPVLGMAHRLLPTIGVAVDAAAVGRHYGARVGRRRARRLGGRRGRRRVGGRARGRRAAGPRRRPGHEQPGGDGGVRPPRGRRRSARERRPAPRRAARRGAGRDRRGGARATTWSRRSWPRSTPTPRPPARRRRPRRDVQGREQGRGPRRAGRPSARPPSGRPPCTRWPAADRPGSCAPAPAWCWRPPGWTTPTSSPGRCCCCPSTPTPAPPRCGPASAERTGLGRRRGLRHPRAGLAHGPDRHGDRRGGRPGRRGLRRAARPVRQRPAGDRRGAGRRARLGGRPGQDQAGRAARRPGPRAGPPRRRRGRHRPRPGPPGRRRTCSATAARRPSWRRCWPRSASPTATRRCSTCRGRARRRAARGPGAPALEPAAAALVERLLAGDRPKRGWAVDRPGGRPSGTGPRTAPRLPSAASRCRAAPVPGPALARPAARSPAAPRSTPRDPRPDAEALGGPYGRPGRRPPGRRCRGSGPGGPAATGATGWPRSRRRARASSGAARSCCCRLRGGRRGPARLPRLPRRQGLQGPRRRPRRDRRPAWATPAATRSRRTRDRQPGARRRGHQGRLRAVAARLGQALPLPGGLHQALLLHRRPARDRDPGPQPRARLHRRLVPRRRARDRDRPRCARPRGPSAARPTTRRRSSSPRRTRARTAPSRTARTSSSPAGPPTRTTPPTRRKQKGVRQTCTKRQRPGHLGLHGQVPGRELARAERRVTSVYRFAPTRPERCRKDHRRPVRRRLDDRSVRRGRSTLLERQASRRRPTREEGVGPEHRARPSGAETEVTRRRCRAGR